MEDLLEPKDKWFLYNNSRPRSVHWQYIYILSINNLQATEQKIQVKRVYERSVVSLWNRKQVTARVVTEIENKRKYLPAIVCESVDEPLG